MPTPPYIKPRPKLSYSYAIIIGGVVGLATYFNLFTIKGSYFTKQGCLKAGGAIERSQCHVQDITVDIRG